VLWDWYLSIIRPYIYFLFPENTIKSVRLIVDILYFEKSPTKSRNIWPPSSGSNNKPKPSPNCLLVHSGSASHAYQGFDWNRLLEVPRHEMSPLRLPEYSRGVDTKRNLTDTQNTIMRVRHHSQGCESCVHYNHAELCVHYEGAYRDVSTFIWLRFI
jgi:hypothetical protein